jgi:DNA-binding NarL/FixJ family response regulator
MKTNRPTVLIAEDHAGILQKVSSLLCEEFEIVSAVMNGEEAVADARRLNPGVLVLDITMPRLSGIQAAQQLRKNGILSKIVFISANEDPEVVSEVFETGTCGYVIKSRLNSDLVFAVEEALAGRAFVSELAL